MCNACGFPSRPVPPGASALAPVLRPLGFTAHDDGVTDGATLSTLSGASVILTDPAQIRATAECLADRAYDPFPR